MYDSSQADLYASYRPELHEVALKLELQPKQYGRGLDVGCGTGHSTRALRRYCGEVIGVDNAYAMLRRAQPMNGVHYELSDGVHWPVRTGSVSVVTFAGSLPYLDQEQAAAELRRVAAPGATVVVYDWTFATLPILRELGFALTAGRQPPFSVATTFASPEARGLRLLRSQVREVVLTVDLPDLAWLLLGEDYCRNLLRKRFGEDQLYYKVYSACERAYPDTLKLMVSFALCHTAYLVHGEIPTLPPNHRIMTFQELNDGVKKAAADAPNLGKSIKLQLDEGVIFIDMTDDQAKVTNEDKEADTTVITSVDVLDQLRSGKLNPMMAMMSGKVKIKGDMGLAMKLQGLLS